MPSKSDFISDGYAFEHRVVGYLESNGWYAIKSHMSKGIVDVVAIKPGGWEEDCPSVKFVQCKLSGNNKKELEKLRELNKKFENAEVVYAELNEKQEIEFRPLPSIFRCPDCGKKIEGETTFIKHLEENPKCNNGGD